MWHATAPSCTCSRVSRARPLAAADATPWSTYRRLDLSWETAASLVLAAYGALMLGDTAAAARDGAEAVGILTPMGDSWGLVHAKAMLGGIAQVEHRFEDAIDALSGAAEESTALGFLGQAALHLGSLARAQQRAGRPEEAAASYDRTLAAATASGDGRMAATARLNLARLLQDHRATAPQPCRLLKENLEWYASAGGGDGALLSRCVLAAETDDKDSLEMVLTLARADENHAGDHSRSRRAREVERSRRPARRCDRAGRGGGRPPPHRRPSAR